MLLLLPLLVPFLCLMRGLLWFGGVRLKNKITPIVCDGILEERLTKDKKTNYAITFTNRRINTVF